MYFFITEETENISSIIKPSVLPNTGFSSEHLIVLPNFQPKIELLDVKRRYLLILLIFINNWMVLFTNYFPSSISYKFVVLSEKVTKVSSKSDFDSRFLNLNGTVHRKAFKTSITTK